MKYQRIPFKSNSFFHVYNHGNAGDNIFKQAMNYDYFLKKYNQYITPIADTFAYCLLPNHFHFIIKIKPENELVDYCVVKKDSSIKDGVFECEKFLSKEWSNFLNAYAKAFNKTYKRRGSLFLDNVRRIQIENPEYLKNAIHYVHFNPVKHDFCKKTEDWLHSSYHSFMSQKNTKLKRDEVISYFENVEGFIKYHRNKPSYFPIDLNI